ncbi:hypothetical protein BDW62DRAFT_55436 [Aspergillus aurantiobrunneus]
MAPTKPSLPPLSTPKNMTFPSELRERTYTCLDATKPVDIKRESCDDGSEMAITPPSAYTEFLNTFSPIFASPNSSRANFSKYMLDKPRPSPTSAPPSAVGFSAVRTQGRAHGHGHGHGHRRSNSNCSGNGSGNSNANTAGHSLKHASTLPVPSPRGMGTGMKSPSKSPDHLRRLRLPAPYGQGHLQNQGHLYTPMIASPLSARSHPHHHHHHHRPSPSEWRFHQLESPAADGGSFSLRQVTTTTITFRVAPRLAAPPVGKRKRAGGRRG